MRHYFSYDCGNAIDYIMTLCWFVPGPMREGFNRFIGLWSGEPRMQGRIQDFKLGGAHLKKLRRAEEGVNILGVFRVKNHYFTPKNHSFYNYGGRREKFWGISCEKSRFYAKKPYFFPILGGRPPLWNRPWNGPVNL